MRVPGPHPAIGGGVTRPHPTVLRDKPHWVYRLYDQENELLYVGCTYLPPKERFKSLFVSNNPSVKRHSHHWVAQQYPDMNTALAVEGMWIDVAAPPFNGMRSGVAARKNVSQTIRPTDTASGLFGHWVAP